MTIKHSSKQKRKHLPKYTQQAKTEQTRPCQKARLEKYLTETSTNKKLVVQI